MDKEQRRRMAERSFVIAGNDDLQIEFTIQVYGGYAEIHRIAQMPWENEQGTGPDEDETTWTMSKDDLKKLIEHAQWCIKTSEEFEKSHPKEWHCKASSSG